MVCIEKRPYTLYGRLATLHFRYLTCLLDRGHIIDLLLFCIISCYSVFITFRFETTYITAAAIHPANAIIAITSHNFP